MVRLQSLVASRTMKMDAMITVGMTFRSENESILHVQLVWH